MSYNLLVESVVKAVHDTLAEQQESKSEVPNINEKQKFLDPISDILKKKLKHGKQPLIEQNILYKNICHIADSLQSVAVLLDPLLNHRKTTSDLLTNGLLYYNQNKVAPLLHDPVYSLETTLQNKQNKSDDSFEDDYYEKIVVMDNGTYLSKVGFSEYDAPTEIFPSCVPDTKYRTSSINDLPIRNRIINNWDHMQHVWNDTFENKLKIDSSTYPIMLSESVLNSNKETEKTTQIMFEQFNVPALCFENESVLSLYTSGKLNGIVLDSGFNMTTAVSIYDGYCIKNSVKQLYVGGCHVDDVLSKGVSDYWNVYNRDKDIVSAIKEKMCYVSNKYDNGIELYEHKYKSIYGAYDYERYQLPDGRYITIRDERFRSCEFLFDKGFQKLMFESFNECDVMIRKELYNNIVLSGGNTMFYGFQQRLRKELLTDFYHTFGYKNIFVDGYCRQQLKNKELGQDVVNMIVKNLNFDSIPFTNVFQIKCSNYRQYNTWIGGAIVASLSIFKDKCVAKNEYDECGNTIVYRKKKN
eukprot:73662_1